MKRKAIILILAITLLISFLVDYSFTGSSVVKEEVPKEQSLEPEVYFCPLEDCEQELTNLLNQAKNSIHCAFYDLDLKNVTKALKESNAEVKLVIDKDNTKDSSGLNFVSNYNSEQLMHNKFCIIDNEIISSGSFNPTERDAYKNNNNFIIIHSKYLSENYEKEFSELWNKEFGQGEKVRYPIINFNDKVIENSFCPEDKCSEKVIGILDSAKESIYFMLFGFTDDNIGDMLVEKSKEGLEVKGVLEKFQNNRYNEFNKLKDSGIDVRWDNNSFNMHHKVFIVDKSIVITGSYNPTKAADTENDENILVFHDKVIAEKFLNEFERVYG